MTSDLPESEKRSLSPILTAAAIACLSFALRLWLAHRWYGFQTGDDLEVAEEAFRRALGLVHQPWEIRNLFIPDVLVAPFVKVAWWCGVRDTVLLNDAARLPFNLLATANVMLVFLLGRRWWNDGTAVVASALYAGHWIPLLFASNSYPRTVAVTCVLLGAILISDQRRAWNAVLAGFLAALALTARYSEIAIALSLMISLRPGTMRRRAAAALLSGLIIGTAIFIGVYDWLTVGRWFGSLAEFAELIFVRRDASSLRVHQPGWWYLTALPHWLAVSALPLIWIAAKRGEIRRFVAFVALPVLVFSAIFHKELRYLQVVIPFALLLAARGFMLLRESRRALATVLLVLSFLLGAGRVAGVNKRSNNAVDAARWMAVQRLPAVAMSQPWAWGGRLFLGNDVRIVDLAIPPRIAVLRETGSELSAVSIYNSEVNPEILAVLDSSGLTRRIDFRGRGGRDVVVFHRAVTREP